MFHKIDNTQLSAVTTSEGKARTALEFKLPSKALDDAIANGGAGMRLLALKDITPLQGGILVEVDGKIIGPSASPGAIGAGRAGCQSRRRRARQPGCKSFSLNLAANPPSAPLRRRRSRPARRR